MILSVTFVDRSTEFLSELFVDKYYNRNTILVLCIVSGVGIEGENSAIDGDY